MIFLMTVLLPRTGRSQSGFQPYSLTKGTYNWHFGGSNNFIRFNRVSVKPELKTGKASLSNGASAAVSDPANGNLLFYTDGQNIFDATNRVMPGGSGLGGNPAGNQTVAVCPVPGQPNKYFVFTNSATNTTTGNVTFTVVDMNSFGNEVTVGGVIRSSPPLGEVEGSKKNVPVISGVAEAMIVVPHGNGKDYWLLTQQPNLNNRPIYFSTLISEATYTTGVEPPAQRELAIPSRASHFAYHPELKLLAVAVSNRQTDALVLNFDDNTGVFNFFDDYLFNSAVLSGNDQAIYDIEWSPSGDYLYYTVHGEDGVVPGNLFQFNRRNSTISIASVLPSTVSRSLGLQRGPDGFIYHLYQVGPSTRIGRIEQPDLPADQVNYVADVFGSLNWSANQFPSVLPESVLDLSLSFTTYGTCQNQPTVFFPQVFPAADSLIWELGSGEIFKGWSPVFSFESGTPSSVKLTAFLNGQSEEVTLPVSIQPFELQIQIPSDTTACRSEFPPPRGTATEETRFKLTAQVSGGNPASLIWSNGQTGNILKPDSAGYYYAIASASDGSGCTAYAGVNIKEYGTTDRRANLWYFGDRAGIDFTTGEVLNDSQMTAPEGCAVIGDQNGKLIFYTDGEKVYNRDHQVIANDIGGNPLSTQSALIIQVPDDETLYYIFTTQANAFGSDYTVYYSLFDLKQNNGLGAVVQTKVPLFSRSTERLTARSGWLITHEFGNDAFRAYRITPEGIGNPVISTIGSEHSYSEPAIGEGYMKAGPRNNLVVPLKTSQGNFLEVFHFLDSLGRVTDFRKIDLQESEGHVYGIEFSGLKLFASITGSPSKIAEYYFNDDDELIFVQKISNPGKIGALQTAPDGLIYIAIEGSSSLGSIGPGDEDEDPSTFNFNFRELAIGTKSLLGLPNYINQFGSGFFQPAITYDGICLGGPTNFEGTPTDRIDQFTWALGDGAGSLEQNVVHNYQTSGLFIVSMNLKNRCGLDTTIVENVRIFDPPARPALPGSAVLCNGPVSLDVGQAGLTYLWTTGDTTQQIVAETEGSYGVLVEDPVSGCRNEAIVIVVDNRPDFDLGPDVTLCEGRLGRVLDAQNPNAQIQWTLNGAELPGSPQRIQPPTDVPGVFSYGLKVTDPITSCFKEDEIVFTIKQAPVFALTARDITSCLTPNDGAVTIRITQPALNSFSYFFNGNGQDISEISRDPDVDYIIENLPAGSYTVVVGDEVTGCSRSGSIGVSRTDASLTVPAASTCSPLELDVQVANLSPPFKMIFTEASGQKFEKDFVGSAQPIYKSPLVGPGTYTVEIQPSTGIGCNLTENNVVVTASPALTGEINTQSCSLPRTVSVSVTNPPSNLSYSWTGPGVTLPSANAASLSVSPTLAAGSYEFKVTVSDPGLGFCPAEFTVPIVIESVAPAITSSDPCADQVSLIANPDQNGFTYLWYRNTSVIPPDLSGFYGLGSRLDLTPADNGVSFRMVARSSVTGCNYFSPSFNAVITGEVTALLTSQPACEDGRLVTFQAKSNQTGISYQWFFNGLPITGSQDTIQRRPEGLYRVVVTKANCTAEASVQMVRGPLPVGELPATVVICNDPENLDPETSQVTLKPGEFVAYEWYKNDLSLGITDPTLVADSEGQYRVLLTNSFQCIAADRTEVINDCVPKIIAPNAFRPGSLVLENNNFFIFSLFITEKFHVFIYNRWGELVFQSSDPDFKWNGGYNNDPSRPLPSGTYAWVVQYVSSFRPNDGIQEKRGGVLLLR